MADEQLPEQQTDDPLAALERRLAQRRKSATSANDAPDALTTLERRFLSSPKSNTIDLAEPATPIELEIAKTPIRLAPAVVMAKPPIVPRAVAAMATGPEDTAPPIATRAVIAEPKVASNNPSSGLVQGAYIKNGHPVVDTARPDADGRVPTHRLDQPTSRLPGESFEQYEDRVLTKNTWSPDTAAHRDLASLEPAVADSAKSLLAQARSKGVNLAVNETRRSQERQEMTFQDGRGGHGGSTHTWTLTSDHTPGRALDFTGEPSALDWLQKNAPLHGFSVMGAMDPGHVGMPSSEFSSSAGSAPVQQRVDAPALAPRDASAVAPNARGTYHPRVTERAGKQIAGFVGEAIEHPGKVAAQLVTAPIKSAADALLTPEVGEQRPDPKQVAARFGSIPEQPATPYDAAHGAQPKGGRTIAGLQTLANVAFPGIEGAVAERATSAGMSKLGGKISGMAVAGAPAGAAYSPDDPFAGAIAGSALASVLGAAHEGAGKVVPVVRDAAAGARDATTAGVRALSDRVRAAAASPSVDPLSLLERKYGLTDEELETRVRAGEGERGPVNTSAVDTAQHGSQAAIDADAVERASFPITADNIVAHSEAKQVPVRESVDRLRAAGYTVSEDVAAEAERRPVSLDARRKPSTADEIREQYGETFDDQRNRMIAETERERQQRPTLPGNAVQINRMPVSEIVPDPERFQYKHGGDAESGAGPELKGLSKFDEQLAGVISVWRDPATGIVHPVNGHNRLALAQRAGHPSVNVQELPATTAGEARAMGALANIAEGRGTALDAAQFFRNSGLGIDDLQDRVSFKGSIARQGLGLSKLAPDLFAKVERGDLTEAHGAAIGEMLSTPEMQRTAAGAIERSGKRLSDGDVREVARQVRDAGSGRAEGLARAGNVIDVDASQRIASESAQLEEVFSHLYTRRGPVSDALTDAARRVANGESPRHVAEGLYPVIRDAVQETLGGREGSSDWAPGIRDRDGEPTPDVEPAEHAGDRVVDSTDSAQSGLFAPDPLGEMERDLFGNGTPSDEPAQRSLLGDRDGTASSRSLRESEAAAGSELEQLHAAQHLETDVNARQLRARRIVELERLTNRGEKIGAEELTQRAVAARTATVEGPDQTALFSPITKIGSAVGAKLRSMVGQPPLGQIARVESLRSISQALAEGVGVPLREGRFRAKQRRALGAFFPKAEVARVVRMDRIDTAAHEVAHYISKEYLRNPTMKGAAGRGAPQLSMAAKRELVQMGKDLYGSRKPTGGYGEEGIAQWGRFYITEPGRLAIDAPVFSQWVEQHVLANEPALQATLDAAQQAFHDHVNAPPTARVDAMLSVNDQSALASGFRNLVTPEKRSWLARKLITYGLDDLGEFKRAVAELGGAKSPTEDAYVLARLTRGAAGMAEEMLDRGIVDPRTGQRVAPAVHDVLATLKPDELQPFRRYLVAERAIELASRGVDAGIAMADALEMRRMYEPQFRARAEQLWQVSNALIDYRVHKGLLTVDEGTAIKAANQRRVGFYRVFDDEEGVGGNGNGKGFGRNSSGIQRAVGSSREIIDPLESVITDVYKTVAQSHAHEAALALYKHAIDTEGGGRIAEIVPAPQVAVEIPVERLKQQLEDLGFIIPNGGLTPLLGVLKSFQDATTAGAREAKDLVVPVILDGERKWLAIKDAQLYDALAGLNQQQLPMWLRIAGAPTRLLRAGATLTGEFIARNPVRDAFTAAVYSQGPVRPPGFLAAEGLFHLVKRDDLYQRWRLAGGDNAAQLGLDRAATQKNLSALLRSTHGKIADVVLHPIDALRMVSGIMENATRIGEFSAVARKARAAGMGRADIDATAAFASRDVTVDFAKAGQVGRAANQLVSFFNANVQGNVKLLAELRSRPTVVLPRIAAMITVPSVALYLLQRDDPAYQEVPQWQKDVAWIVVQRDAHGMLQHIWRIPKPPELGILFGSTFERALQFIDHHDPRALDEIVSSLGNTLNPVHIPDALRPAVEWWANKSFFRDRPIVPSGMEKLPPAEQSTRYTGESARLLGRLTNTSPAKLENTVSSAAGGLGVYAMQGADAAVRLGRRLTGGAPLAGAEAHSSDVTTRIPVVRGFAVRQPGGDAESVARTVKDFHDAEGHRLAWQRMLETGDRQRAAEYLNAHRATIVSVATKEENGGSEPGRLRSVYDSITQLQKQSADVSNQVRESGRAAVIQRKLADRQVQIARAYRMALQIAHGQRDEADNAQSALRATIPRRQAP